MAPQVQDPFDSSHSVLVGSNTWEYLRARPSGKPKGTVLLLHGFPDIPYGWRHQVPFFISLGYQVIAPYMLGYGGTSSPSDVDSFSLKKQSDDLAALIDTIVPGEQVILGGHDWGAGLVWPFATYYPQLFKGIFSVTFAYLPPETKYVDIADLVARGVPTTYKYRLQWREPAFDRTLRTADDIRQFLLACYGAKTPDGRSGFTPDGINLDTLPHLRQPSLLSDEELEHHIKEFQRRGFRGPLNWYRTAKINFEDELPIAQAGGNKFKMPVLFIQARNDPVLIPELSKGMDKYFDKLTRAEVNTGHWALIEGPSAVNKEIKDWLATFD
ncbi:alpha/beta-hydrolase [Hypoxylon trugodes]|uniref:alpha/beta-hydrolase n=1 Tax=Hypoxylon trugodes TaxID=326681 RepID=UPI002198090E|nr:alpha/beta-hydrolase [Hypoxylon trugodes]KAI1383642.1 alpha/beta-hydrolase [Hypoxylon trugodes]